MNVIKPLFIYHITRLLCAQTSFIVNTKYIILFKIFIKDRNSPCRLHETLGGGFRNVIDGLDFFLGQVDSLDISGNTLHEHKRVSECLL